MRHTLQVGATEHHEIMDLAAFVEARWEQDGELLHARSFEAHRCQEIFSRLLDIVIDVILSGGRRDTLLQQHA